MCNDTIVLAKLIVEIWECINITKNKSDRVNVTFWGDILSFTVTHISWPVRLHCSDDDMFPDPSIHFGEYSITPDRYYGKR